MPRDDVPGVKLVRIAGRFPTQNDGGIQRLSAASRTVGHKVQIGVPLRVAGKVSGRRGLFALQNCSARFREVAFNSLHFVFGLRKLFELVARLQRISNQQKVLLLG